MLINNLKADKEAFAACNISEKARAENVSLEQWKCTTRVLLFYVKYSRKAALFSRSLDFFDDIGYSLDRFNVFEIVSK